MPARLAKLLLVAVITGVVTAAAALPAGSVALSKVYRAVARTLAASLQGQPERDFEAPSLRIAMGERGRGPRT